MRKVVRQTTSLRGALARNVLACNSSRGRTRTCDPLINSQLLYQLSYSGKRAVGYPSAPSRSIGFQPIPLVPPQRRKDTAGPQKPMLK